MAVTQTDTHLIKFTAGSDAITGKHFIKYFRWVGAASADDITVTDTAGNTIYQGKANSDNYTETVPFGEQVTGITVATLDGGTFYACIG